MESAQENRTSLARRPIRARKTRWAALAAARLVRLGLQPNQVSVASAVIGCAAGGAMLASAHAGSPLRAALLLTAAMLIPLRGICNLLDGMMAIEGGLKTPDGVIYNDFPDRLSDAALLVGAGYSTIGPPWMRELGWAAALLAMMTAYVRLLGGAAGLPQDFCGPMAKPHRMAVLTAACVLSAIQVILGWSGATLTMGLALGIVSLGSLFTVVRRISRAVRALRSSAGEIQ
jgi:phosphatidylglycerophosphate synthase